MFDLRKSKDEKATSLESIEKSVLNPREDMEDDGIIQIQKKSKEVLVQELQSHLQNFQETFNETELNNWKTKHDILFHALTSI